MIIQMLNIVFTALLLLMSLEDISTKYISNLYLLFLNIVGLIIFIIDFNKDKTLGLIFGLVILILSYYFKYLIGDGDGKVILAIGFAYGYSSTLEVLKIAFLSLAAVSILCCIIKNKNPLFVTFPFIPFIAIGFLFNQYIINIYDILIK